MLRSSLNEREPTWREFFRRFAEFVIWTYIISRLTPRVANIENYKETVYLRMSFGDENKDWKRYKTLSMNVINKTRRSIFIYRGQFYIIVEVIVKAFYIIKKYFCAIYLIVNKVRIKITNSALAHACVRHMRAM